MSSNRPSTIRRRRFWTGVLERWQLSDLSVREFCKQEGVAEASFTVGEKISLAARRCKRLSPLVFLK